MQYIRSSEFSLKNTCVTLGKFDGLHLGHQKLLKELAAWKQNHGGSSVMFTFDFHPGMLFGNRSLKLLYTEEEKKDILRDAGIDVFVAYPFTKETSAMEPEDFIEHILVKQLDMKMIVVGEDNRFGHNRRGDVAMLRRFSKQYGFEVIVCDKVRCDGDIVSSTRVREAVTAGDIEIANRLLGRRYQAEGTACLVSDTGFGAGAMVLSLAVAQDKLMPPPGEYRTECMLEGRQYSSRTRISEQESADSAKRTVIETIISGFSAADIPAARMEQRLFFLKQIRLGT